MLHLVGICRIDYVFVILDAVNDDDDDDDDDDLSSLNVTG